MFQISKAQNACLKTLEVVANRMQSGKRSEILESFTDQMFKKLINCEPSVQKNKQNNSKFQKPNCLLKKNCEPIQFIRKIVF